HWIDRPDSSEPARGDGMLTDRAGLLLSVRTADCLPVLLLDPKRRIVGTLHAGWRGTLGDITGGAVRRLIAGGSDPGELIVAFGPVIGACCYEVGPEVVAAFLEKFAEGDSFFGASSASGRRHLDLQQANRTQVMNLGLKPEQVLSNSFCTRCHADLFFSYRRD